MSIDDTSPVPEPRAETGQDSAQTTDTELQPTDTVGAVSVHPNQEISPHSQQGGPSFIADGDHTRNSIINIGGGGSMVANNLDNVGVINVQQDGALEVYDLNNFGIINVQQGGALEVHNLDNFGIINAQDGASLVLHDPHDLGIINAPQITFTTVSSLHGKDDTSGVTPSEVENSGIEKLDPSLAMLDLDKVPMDEDFPETELAGQPNSTTGSLAGGEFL